MKLSSLHKTVFSIAAPAVVVAAILTLPGIVFARQMVMFMGAALRTGRVAGLPPDRPLLPDQAAVQYGKMDENIGLTDE